MLRPLANRVEREVVVIRYLPCEGAACASVVGHVALLRALIGCHHALPSGHRAAGNVSRRPSGAARDHGVLLRGVYAASRTSDNAPQVVCSGSRATDTIGTRVRPGTGHQYDHSAHLRGNITVTTPTAAGDALAAEAAEHLRALVRFDTTNPPGNETPAAEYLAGVLGAAGVKAQVIESAPGRGSLVARLGASVADSAPEPALLLHAHLDVVPARAAEGWTHDPFAGDLADGCVWGRGALDDKAAVAMMLVAVLALHRSGRPLRRDVIFAATADEEAGGYA